MEADPVNLVPAVGEVNGDSNYSFSIIPGEERVYGACDFEIKDRKAEPGTGIRGDIARIYLYMDKKYPGKGIISKKNKKLFEAWDKNDPVSKWERERNERLLKVFGFTHEFVLYRKTFY